VAETIDARGLRCPMPTLKLQKALRDAPAGTEIVLLADDPMSRIDVPHYCGEAGAELLGVEPSETGWAFRVLRSG